MSNRGIIPIKDANKEDISAMMARLRDAKADLQIDMSIKLVNRHRKENSNARRMEIIRSE